MNIVYVVQVDLQDDRGYVDSIYSTEKSAQERIVEFQNGDELSGAYAELSIEEHNVK